MFGSKVITENFLKKMADGAEMYQGYPQSVSRVLLGPLDTSLSSTPYEIVYSEDRIKLKHYTSNEAGSAKIKTPLLITYALVNRETMLDLQPDRSVVKSFLKDGIELYSV